MNSFLDIIPFVKVRKKNYSLALYWSFFIIISFLIFPLNWLLYASIMKYDYNKLKHYIEFDVLDGCPSIFDYSTNFSDNYIISTFVGDRVKLSLGDGSSFFYDYSNHFSNDDMINQTAELLHKQSRGLSSFDMVKSLAKERLMAGFVTPSSELSSSFPYKFMAISKNEYGGYSVISETALGIGCKHIDNIKPNLLFESGVAYLKNHQYNTYTYDINGINKITMLLPSKSYPIAKYDEKHLVSKYHSLDSQFLNFDMNLPSSGVYSKC